MSRTAAVRWGRALFLGTVGLCLVGTAPVAAQSITSFQPESGAEGTIVRIYGSGFDATASNNTVTFGDTEATVDSAKTNILYAKVPSGVSGPVQVEVTIGGMTVTAVDRFMAVSGGQDPFVEIDADLGGGIDRASFAWGDYDGDGDVDLALAGQLGFENVTKIFRNDGDGSFTPVEEDLTGVLTGSLAWGDYDSDGDPDLVVAGSDGSYRVTTIYQNEGGGNFTEVNADLKEGYSAAWGDYNGDGHLDLTVGGRIYRNEGDGSFTEIDAGLPNWDSASMTWGDYNGDGALDIAVVADPEGTTRRETKIYRNEGDETFTAIEADLRNMNSRASIAWRDYNGDGKLDLAASGGGVGSDGFFTVTKVYRNEGSNNFTEVYSADGVDGGALAWGDYDGDGRPDFAITGESDDGFDDDFVEDSKTSIYRNEGEGSFGAIEEELPEMKRSSLAWGDFDGNGSLDLVLAGEGEVETVTKLYRNQGGDNLPPVARTDSFRTTQGQTLTVSASGVLVNDSDPLGDPLDASPATDASDGTLTLHDDGSFEYTPNSGFIGEDSFTYEAVDDDGAVDEATVTIEVAEPVVEGPAVTNFQPKSGASGTTLRIYGTGFDPMPSNNTVKFGSTEATVDSAKTNVLYTQVPSGVGGPVQVEVTIGETTVSAPNHFLALNAGGASFATIGADQLGDVRGTSLAWGDYNGDGSQDLVFAGQDSDSQSFTKIYRNEGDGTFTDIEAGLTATRNGSLAWGDFDADGDLDLAISGISGDFGSTVTKIYRNEGSGNFTAVGANLPGVEYGSLAWGDYNGDGALDLALTGAPRDYNLPSMITKIYRNEGEGAFTDIEAGMIGTDHGAASWGDYNGDGRLDLSVSGVFFEDDYGTKIYKNEGGGNFTAIDAGLSGARGTSVAWGNYNDEGGMDLAVSNGSVYRNEGDGSFTAVADLGGGGSVDWIDYDGDGTLDLAFQGQDIYKNEGDGSFTEIDAGVTETTPIDWGDYNGDGALDLVVRGNDTALIYRNEGNGPPVAEADSFQTTQGQTLGVSAPGVLENDSDPDRNSLTASLVSDVSNGTLTLNSDGSFEYTSDSDFAGMDEFEYEVSDGKAADQATVTIEVGEAAATPSGVTATVTDAPAVDVTWDAVDSESLDGYNVYRATEEITGSPSEHEALATVGASTTSYTDEPEVGGTYHYAITAVDSEGNESGFSEQASTFLYPQTVAAEISRSFNAAAGAEGYRLVALPGQVDRPLADAISGEVGTQWQAYRDDGSESDFLQKYDGSDAFVFEAGAGYWMTHTEEWTFSEELSTVELEEGQTASIDLREGWNVISNPLDKDVGWSAIEAANEGALQALWGFDGSFSEAETFASAASGEAYYFLNDSAEREELVVPYPGASSSKSAPESQKSEEAPLLIVRAESADGTHPASTVQVGIGATEAVVAPPGRFEAVSLRIEAKSESEGRSSLLMAERRSMEGEGETFQLRLTSRVEGPIALSAENLEAIEGKEAALLDPTAGETYDLRSGEQITVDPEGESTTLKLAVGSKSYVDRQREQVLPTEVSLTSYPNPAREQGTLEYALPEETEVTLRVYDVLGREVATLAEGRKEAGRHTVRLEASRLSSGVYFGRLQAEGQTLTQKITVVR